MPLLRQPPATGNIANLRWWALAGTLLILLAGIFWIRRDGHIPGHPSVDHPTQAQLLRSANWIWTEPQNLGPLVNTPAHERTPWVSEDQKTLLFMSSRSGGFGEGDIWTSERASPLDEWSVPRNLGASINSAARDIGASMTPDALTLIFDSRRTTGVHKGDLYISKRETQSDDWTSAIKLPYPVNTKSNE